MAYARQHKINNKSSKQGSDIEDMSNWNPMADAYKNKDFNAFTEGPGADLDDDLQPGALAANANRDKGQNHASEGRYKIVLRNVPKTMTKIAIRNFCSNYGKVLRVDDSSRCPNMAFITFATLNDLTNTLTSINDDNKFGIIAEFGRRRENRNENKEKKDNYNSKTNSVCSDQSFKENKTPSTKHQFSNLDMKRRVIKGPFTNPPRLIHIKNEPFVTEYDYKNSNLIIIDPKRYFLIEKDMHYKDRIKKYEINNTDEDEKYGKLIHTGRSYYMESREKMDHMKKLSESSEGKFNQENNFYEKRCSKNTSNDIILKKCGFCAKLANKICEGCENESYCSVECQRTDWHRHQHHCNVEERHFGVESESRKLSTKLVTNDQMFDNENKRQYNDNDNKSNISRNSNNNFQNNTSRINHQNKLSQQNNTNSKSTQQTNDNKTKLTSLSSASSSAPPISSELPSSSSSSLSLPSDKNHEEPYELIKKKSFKYVNIPKSGSHIAITSVASPNLFYIRSMDTEDDIQYVKILNVINGYTTNAKNFKNLPKRGDICLTDFQNTGYYRALVLNPINEHKIIVIYIDFGNIEEKNLTDLKEAPQEVQYLKCYTIPVRLKNVPDFIPLQNLKDYIYSYVDRLDLDLKLIYDDGIATTENDYRNIEVEIIDTTNNICINKKILEMRVINEPKDRDVPILREDIEQKFLPSGENIEVFVLDNSLLNIGFISCILPQNYLPIQELSAQLKEYAEKIDGVYTPRTSEICVVKYDEDNEWYRAECLEVVGDEHPSVQFIDYGNMLPVHISKIRKYPKAFENVPCYTSNCMIDGLPEIIDENLNKRLQEIIPINEKLIITEVTSKIIDGDTNLIYLPKVIDQLKAEKLL